MRILDIIESAIKQNIDCDANGHVDGVPFATEQIIRDLRNDRFKIVNKQGNQVDMAKAIQIARKRQDAD